jgi:hypothetical protein
MRKPILVFHIALVFLSASAASEPGRTVIPSGISEHEWSQLTGPQRISARETEFVAFYNRYLDEKGYRLGNGAMRDFRWAAEEVAGSIEDLSIAEQLQKIKEAEGNFIKVIDAMIVASRSIPGYAETNYRVIGEDTFQAALKRLCPIWPFCS